MTKNSTNSRREIRIILKTYLKNYIPVVPFTAYDNLKQIQNHFMSKFDLQISSMYNFRISNDFQSNFRHCYRHTPKMDYPPLLTPSTPETDANSDLDNSSTTGLLLDVYNYKFNIVLSKISCTLMASLASKDSKLKDVRDCILTENEEN